MKSFRLTSKTARQLAASYILEVAPDDAFIFVKKNKRSLVQSAKFHAMIDDVAEQLTHYGQKLPAWKWKQLFLASLSNIEILPGIDPGTFVPMRKSSADLEVPEAADLIELIYAYCADKGVIWSDEEKKVAVLEEMRR